VRPDWDDYFLGLARQVATRATCDRLHVGCVLVRDRVVVATGYNGAARGLDHCDDAGHDVEDGHCVRAVHAEANAVAQAAREGVRVLGATAYATHLPCWPCFRLLLNAGVTRVVFGEPYRANDPGASRVVEAATRTGVELAGIRLGCQ
jgi:dCMP deaminase